MLYYLYELGEWARKAGYESDFLQSAERFQLHNFSRDLRRRHRFPDFHHLRQLDDPTADLTQVRPAHSHERGSQQAFRAAWRKEGHPHHGRHPDHRLDRRLRRSSGRGLENPFVWLVLFSTLFLGGIGFYDDWLKVSKKSSKGISSRLKFGLQCVLAGIFTVFFLNSPKLAEIAQATLHSVLQGTR